jgi:hypothetical protein
MDLLLHPQTFLSIPWISVGWLLGGAYTTFKMYQLFVDPHTGTPPGPIKLLINTGLIISIPAICFFSWPILLGTMLGMDKQDSTQ